MLTKSLVIVESPAKCKKIASFLGPGFQVLATMGHIRALEEDLDAVGLERDFEPKYQFLKEKAKALCEQRSTWIGDGLPIRCGEKIIDVVIIEGVRVIEDR